MGDTDHMPNITQTKLKQLVGHDASGVTEAKQRVIGKHGAQRHGPRVENAFMAEITQTAMAVYDLNVLPDEDLPQNRKGAEHRRKGRAAIDDPVRQMIDLEAICQVANACAAGIRVAGWTVGVRDDYDMVAAVDEFLYEASVMHLLTVA